jgi:acyl-coenzyme A thioesterase PaaI-like protein
VNRGRSVAFLEGELRGPDSKLIAKASATYRIFKEDSEQS